MNRYIGKRLDGRYEIRELVGIGGMADVYKAYDLADQREVAVKILKEEYLSNEDFKRRFRNESKAIAVLSHPNIVKIYDVNFEDSVQYIVMEYINGITLKEYIEQQGMVSWKEAVHFTVQILRALQHAHDNGIVHRDVKPQNVMLLQDGTVKVMDFGIARFARDNGRTISEKAIGSVHYISPEQARGDVTDEKTDIYSVGVLMFEMLTGKLPFDGDSPVAVAIKQMQAEAEKPRDLNPQIPVGLEEIIIRAMKKDPDLRYQTAAEMLRDIDEFKRNPNTVFEYKYFTDDSDTRYFDVVGEDGDVDEGGEKVKKRMSPTMQVLMAVAAACVVVAIIAVVIFFTAIREPTPEFKLYDFVGKSYEDIMENLDQYDKVKIVKGSEELSDQYEAGVVMKQDPKAGSVVKENSKVTLTISSGLKSTKVPDVTGKDKDEAEEILREAGFEVNLIRTFSQSVEEDKVISTTPSPGEEANIGQVINVSYSAGDANTSVVVPDLTNKTENEAKQLLTSLGLVPKAVQRNSDKPMGTVIGQALLANREVSVGTMVEFYVSTGTPTETEREITIPFESNSVNETCTFDITVDGESVGSVSFNPATDGSFTWKYSSYGEREIVIRVKGQVFAIITMNFDTGENQKTVTQGVLQNTVSVPSSPEEETGDPIQVPGGNTDIPWSE
ncbi:MAG: Stk1 family PASTA domain-containing Ser/Thr kinase [Massiliimalia sp.]